MFFEPEDGGEVEEVGGLVEEEDVAALEEDGGNVEAREAPVREARDGTVDGGGLEAEAFENCASAYGGGFGIHLSKVSSRFTGRIEDAHQ